MIKRLSIFLTACFLFGLVLRADNIVDEIIARVDDSIITRSDYEKAKQADMTELQQQFPTDWQPKWDQRQKEVLRGLIDRQLLLDKGKELGITGETETVKRLDKMRKDMNLPSMDALEEEARKQGISFEDFKEQIRTGVVAEQVIAQEVGSKLQRGLTTEEAQDWYNKHQKELEGPEEVRLSEIMVSTQPPKPAADNAKPATDNKDNTQPATKDNTQPATKDNAQPATSDNAQPATDQQPAQQPASEDPAEKARIAAAEAKANGLLEQLKKGSKFEVVAKQSSDGPTAPQGGDLGSFKPGELAKELEEKTFSLKPGSYTDVIRTRQGFIILKVDSHRPAGVPPFPEVEDQIKSMLYSQKLEPAARAYLTKLREQAYIDIKEGYVDTGASPHQGSKPELVAAAGSAPATSKQPKKKKKFLVF